MMSVSASFRAVIVLVIQIARNNEYTIPNMYENIYDVSHNKNEYSMMCPI